VPLSTPSPKVNEGAGEAVSSTGEPLALAAPFSTRFSASEIAVEGLSVVEMLGFAFRAGAAALAEPADVATENPELDGAVASVLLNVISGAASAAACGAIFAETVCVFDVVINGESICFGTAFAESVDSEVSVIPLEAEATKFVCGVLFGAGTLVVARGAIGAGGRDVGIT